MKKKISIYNAARAALKRKSKYDKHVEELKVLFPPKKIASSEEGEQALIKSINERIHKLEG